MPTACCRPAFAAAQQAVGRRIASHAGRIARTLTFLLLSALIGLVAVAAAKPALAQPILELRKSHSGDGQRGQSLQYSLSVRNTGTTDSSGIVTRSNSLPKDSYYPLITLTVLVAANAPASVTNTATISGGGAPPASTTDPTTIVASQLISMSASVPGSDVAANIVS